MSSASRARTSAGPRSQAASRSGDVTVGIDIGTTAVKALAVDGDGTVLARARVPHELRVPSPGRLEHVAAEAWQAGPLRALEELGRDDVAALSVAAMVPSLTAVDRHGTPRTPGLLYGDERGRTAATAGHPAELGELLGFMRWTAKTDPEASGFWPAQSVANHALCGVAALDTTTATTAYPLFDWTGWDPAVAEDVGVRVDQLPKLVPTAQPIGRIADDGPVVASGCIDALAEQLVAAADAAGDVLVILGATLIVWVVVDEAIEVEGFFTVPHTTPGLFLVGGPSNAGGLFLDWVARLLHDGSSDDVRPAEVPVWAPYPRGERVPFHDPQRRAHVRDLDLTHDAAALRRGAFEASGFAARRILEHVGHARRIVATGGGVRVDEWIQALADATELPVDCVAVPEGGALGSAWLARLAASLEPGATMADARRWARTARRVEPDPSWVEPMHERYERFRSP